MNIDTLKISRVTLVDETGRVYERWNLDVMLSIQDDGRTLKVFAAPKIETGNPLRAGEASGGTRSEAP